MNDKREEQQVIVYSIADYTEAECGDLQTLHTTEDGAKASLQWHRDNKPGRNFDIASVGLES